jgi:hypothetical protein
MKNNQSTGASPMERSATLKAKDLRPAEREWIAAVLQLELSDEDEFTVSVRRPVVRIPDPKEQEEAREGLRKILGAFHERMKNEPEEEVAAAIDDAFEALRSGKT